MAKVRWALIEIALGVRPAMRKPAVHAAQYVARITRRSRQINEAAQAAHGGLWLMDRVGIGFDLNLFAWVTARTLECALAQKRRSVLDVD